MGGIFLNSSLITANWVGSRLAGNLGGKIREGLILVAGGVLAQAGCSDKEDSDTAV